MCFEEILKTKRHNDHYLNRYIAFIHHCLNEDKKASSDQLEKHHICPKAEGLFPEYKDLSKHRWNLVELTPRQHYIAHHMLWKAYGGPMTYSFNMMSNFKKYDKRISARTYELLKKDQRITHSVKMKQYYADNPDVLERMRERMSGENSPAYGRSISDWHKKRLREGGEAFYADEEKVNAFRARQSERFSDKTKCPFYGKSHSPETRAVMSEKSSGENNSMYGRTNTPEKRKEHSERMKGEGNPLYGKLGKDHPAFGSTRTDEQKQKMSGGNNHRAKPVRVNDVYYGCIKDAAKAYEIKYLYLYRTFRSGLTESFTEKTGITKIEYVNERGSNE